MRRPKFKLVDLFCGAGGSAVGYARAGFDVTGVDITPMPRYPFAFVQADALAYVREHGHEYDVIHASPPCQAHMTLRHWTGKTYPELVAPTRAALIATGRPYVIENVPGAPLVQPLMLCGSMFGLRVIRHRIFETTAAIWASPATCSHPRGAVGRRGNEGTRAWVTVTGHFAGVAQARRAMGIDWMTRDELSQAIPPAYTEYVGRHVLAAIQEAARPAWVPCETCEDFWCSIHDRHAYDCDCPAIEEWETDPYSGGGLPVDTGAPA